MNSAVNISIWICVAIVLIVSNCASGHCLDYGHSCLGGHGKKRSDPLVLRVPDSIPSELFGPQQLGQLEPSLPNMFRMWMERSTYKLKPSVDRIRPHRKDMRYETEIRY